ncbi:MAG: ABC transporter ATP-binding protein [Synergistaceae bacterium]|jgi:peptide/nickel transport system ATP-binding protein|nr:ABC transporter ATP-binding protein [Synergistaceae bacterium]MDD2350398.1 ABC transporter ATP-binding protein [Synergistaceae bacterium]MDD3318863.1 ABC transporter ATP-binding protein [Synergistaceae bacterium]MDD3672466.1 ABC transporter ATP-binding protein [Synergistaceae bacterium]MDD3963678.1 ABC transporter ATP-binding protein [Synergistaceae bacterium]
MDNKIIEAVQLTVSFRSKKGPVHKAVRNISLSLAPGERLAVVGGSGSGKTTLLRALVGLVRPEEGSVALFGRDLSLLGADELAKARQKCGYVQQDPYGAIPPGLSALDAVCEPAVIAGLDIGKNKIRERAEALLAELGLRGDRILKSRAVSLSGGQRQRVQIARALMLSPKILLCDEPTSMQDASTRGEVVDVLEKYATSGTAMIFVTHDLLLAGNAAERIMVMKEGRLCEEGSSEQILNFPEDPYTVKLISSIPSFEKLAR